MPLTQRQYAGIGRGTLRTLNALMWLATLLLGGGGVKWLTDQWAWVGILAGLFLVFVCLTGYSLLAVAIDADPAPEPQ